MENSGMRTALVYDFDNTLAPGNMQEHSFIGKMGGTKEDFWGLVGATARQQDADEILVYMQLMLELARKNRTPITRESLREHGKDIPLYAGLADKGWFLGMNAFAASLGLHLEHYLISSGNLEIVEGCRIFDQFAHVFASRFLYKKNVAIGPGVAINYTTKTQYLFRINKGICNSWDNSQINEFKPEHEKPIPFERMIYVGDGDTDVPSMKVVEDHGGHSIAVYDPGKDARSLEKIHKLIAHKRVSFVAEADYSKKSPMDIVVRGLLERIARKHAAPV